MEQTQYQKGAVVTKRRDECRNKCASEGMGTRCGWMRTGLCGWACLSVVLAVPHPWTDRQLCAHGGDPESCSGHGKCDGQLYNTYGINLGAPQGAAPWCQNSNWGSWPGNNSAKCICDEGWDGMACSVHVAAGEVVGENQMPYPEPGKTTFATYAVKDGALKEAGNGVASTTNYGQLQNTFGMCGQNWKFNVQDNLPYEIRADGSVGDRIEGVAAINPLMFGERIVRNYNSKESRPNYPNPTNFEENGTVYNDYQASGAGCGTCFRLHNGPINVTVVIGDRCGGNCLAYPGADVIQGLEKTITEKYGSQVYSRWLANAGRGANWTHVADNEPDILKYLVNSDCSNNFITSGYETGSVADSVAPSTTNGNDVYRVIFVEKLGRDIADHCAHNSHPHFDLSDNVADIICPDEQNCMLTDYEVIACSPIAGVPETGKKKEGYWLNGCDPENFQNCPSDAKWEPSPTSLFQGCLEGVMPDESTEETGDGHNGILHWTLAPTWLLFAMQVVLQLLEMQ